MCESAIDPLKSCGKVPKSKKINKIKICSAYLDGKFWTACLLKDNYFTLTYLEIIPIRSIEKYNSVLVITSIADSGATE